ncbi:MAG: cardiolipin synthase [Deltaproteobacteria bacterium]|nr:cardiolipin synthase [Deltaproteobacteria bacterium]
MEDIHIVLVGVIYPFVEILGILTALYAIRTVRSSQAAIAWAISLVTFPFLALPLYWIFGRNRFSGYVEAIRQGEEEHTRQVDEIMRRMKEEYRSDPDLVRDEFEVFENLNRGYPFLRGNSVDLLVDGEATFTRMFEDMDRAEDYILLQYFIVHDDELGKELKSRLIAKAEEGVRVYFLYDEIGCHKLPRRYIKKLRKAGVHIHPFGTTQGRGNRFQLNFRNHRKITVVDGKIGYVGGHNIGDEYMGRSRKFGHWRDTHLRIDGPSVRHVQMSFVADWYFAARSLIPVNWDAATSHPEGTDLLILQSGPADPMDTCSLMFVLAIHAARSRMWISSPYFIPNEAVIAALRTAALRGVDVRIMIPLKPDHRVVYLAGFAFMAELKEPNIRFFRYEPGFLHQKAFVVDERLAMVGTANADNRSFRLNFEISALGITQGFVQQVAQMLESDFSKCREVPADEGFTRGFLFDSGVRLARLFSPIL